MVKLRKMHAKNTYLGSILIPERYVFSVCFESPFTKRKYKWPPPPPGILALNVETYFHNAPRKMPCYFTLNGCADTPREM